MKKNTFQNSDVVRILNIPQRRVLNAVEKGLVVPKVDSSGAGSKREYDYTNLLELGLIETLFDIGLGLHLVKKIVSDLREAGDFREWVEDWDNYFLKAAEKLSEWIKEHRKRNKLSRTPFPYDPENTEDPTVIKDAVKPKKPFGILFYTFKKDGFSKKRIVPWEIKTPWDESNFLIAPFFCEDIVTGKAMVIVNLGEIKEKIDAKLEEKE